MESKKSTFTEKVQSIKGKKAAKYDELEINYIKLKAKLDAIENLPEEKPAEVDDAEEKTC
ncbi:MULTISPECIES: hypothetical protein [Bacillus cereus group]|uniref:hypothetical protein n=1 Tax=Bacillus cereus group TaxID=86661 RepID=UPI0007B6C634|nr:MULTISPECIES: hypothetical protein [Bacillus cereus group]ANC22731.1 hypothetical protein WR52_28800 [Bacillus cereus]